MHVRSKISTTWVVGVHEYSKSIRENVSLPVKLCKKCNENYTCWFFSPSFFTGLKLRPHSIEIEFAEV